MNTAADRKKRVEQHFVDEAARLLGETWISESRERPDFKITSSGYQFGLEVSEICLGASDEGGSRDRMCESHNIRWLTGIRREIEQQADVSLDLKYLGEVSPAARAWALETLHAERWNCQPMGHEMKLPPDDEIDEIESYRGKLWATKATHSRSTFLNDSCGWVSRNTTILQGRISEKARKLAAYRTAFEDVRLLLVADRTRNSGKLAVLDDIAVDLCGFDTIYFLSYPVEIAICRRDQSA